MPGPLEKKNRNIMKRQTRRGFINSLVGAGVGLQTRSLGTFNPESHMKKDRPGNRLPVIDEVDICVLGGSCTGVFAAVRAARLGASVAVVEKQNAFGGVATNSFVNIWHSLKDTEFQQDIIAGLTAEVIDRLSLRDAIIASDNNPSAGVTFNSQELKIELDELVLESRITPYLHTLFSEPCLDEADNLTGIIVDNKSGRGIIRARNFIDATGDGDLCFRLGLETYVSGLLQPPTTCAHLEGWDGDEFYSIFRDHHEEFDIPEGFVWGSMIPYTGIYMMAGTRVYDVNGAIADDLTKAEMEGRRQVRAIMDMMRKYSSRDKLRLVGLPSHIGIRETRHIRCLYQVGDRDAMYGRRFEDAIANGSYRLDIHHQDKPGLTFYYLDGTEVYSRPGFGRETKRWREETETDPTFYQVPLRSIIPPKFDNLMIAGRMLDASRVAFSGIRVMVNMNQLGEAAGVTSFLSLDQDKPVRDIDPLAVRETLKQGGSIII
jgi:hypothetical protein